jgi:tetratricopeptide (TPR) repeat protein
MSRQVLLSIAVLIIAAPLSRAQNEAPTKWVKGDQVMPKNEKIELKCGTRTLYSVTDVKWPVVVQKVNGHWLMFGDDGTNRVDGKAIKGWVSSSDVIKFRPAKPNQIVDQTKEQVVRQYSEKLSKSKSLWLYWLRGICLEQLGDYDAAISDYNRVAQPGSTEMPSAETATSSPPSPAPPCAEPGSPEPAPPEVFPFPDERQKRTADALAGIGRCLYLRRAWADDDIVFGVPPSDITEAQNKFDEAISIYLQAQPGAGRPPAPPRYLCDKASSLYNNSDDDFFADDKLVEADGLINTILEVAPSFVAALSLQGDIRRLDHRIALRSTRRRMAIQSYQQVIAADPTNPLGYYKLAFTLNQKTTSTIREQELAVSAAKAAAQLEGYTYLKVRQLRTAEFINLNLREAAARQSQLVDLAPADERYEQLEVLIELCAIAHVAAPTRLAAEEAAARGSNPRPPQPAYVEMVRRLRCYDRRSSDQQDCPRRLQPELQELHDFYELFGESQLSRALDREQPANGPESYLYGQLRESP